MNITDIENPYDSLFFKDIQERSLNSAREITPIILEYLKPKSVIDIGCGTGAWLLAFTERGINEIQGVDGSNIDDNLLCIPKECFLVHDLIEPLKIDRKYDLVISLEVAEHLPPDKAPQLVSTLTSLGPVIVFSAAIPKQGGTNHINEQWPEYWASLFLQEGYVAIDCIRKKIWKNEKVEFYYAQNMFIYVRKDVLHNYPQLEREFSLHNPAMFSIVHPIMFLQRSDLADPDKIRLQRLLKICFNFIDRKIVKKIVGK